MHLHADSSSTLTMMHVLTTATGRLLNQWLLTLTWACLMLHVLHEHAHTGGSWSADASQSSPHFRLNKTYLDQVNKLVWMNRFRKALEVAEGQSSRAANEIQDDGGVARGRSVTHAPPVTVTPGASGSGSDSGGAGGKDRPQFKSIPPLIVFSNSEGPVEKNVLEFSFKRPTTYQSPSSTVSKINLYLYVWKRREGRRLRRNRRRFRKRLIKIRVFQVSERNRKGKRIAELRKNVQSSHWHRLSLPVSLVHQLWESNNGTLKLRVRCKRCKRKVQLFMPSDVIKCNKKRSQRQKLKANRLSSASSSSSPSSSPISTRRKLRALQADKKCSLMSRGVSGLLPFMVIENKGGYSSRSGRSKRHAARKAATPEDGETTLDGSSIPTKTLSSSGRNSVAYPFLPQTVEKIMDMSTTGSRRLQRSTNLTSVPSPSLTAAAAVKTLGTSASMNPTPFLLRVVEKLLKGEVPAGSVRPKRSAGASSSSTSPLPGPTRICNPSPRHSDCCVVAVPVDPAEYGMGDSIVAPTTLTATSCEGACPASRRRRRMRGSGRRGGRRKKGRQWSCQPVEQQPLEIWYFDHNHELAYASLPGLVISQCACRRQ
ncbi:uncharacterized protein LOC143279468 [Babylonia areolata]|uniref:uncharacterized protein LOC143279468 n=1 Tax=Babylonia areolata TaxID=304850 RepID=UPI003FD57758